MGTVERIYNEVRSLPEPQALEVLDFVTRLKFKAHEGAEVQRQTALSVLAKLRGRFEAARINRDELYDRSLR